MTETRPTEQDVADALAYVAHDAPASAGVLLLHIAALTADNAALVDMLKRTAGVLRDLAGMPIEADFLEATANEPHPGAALLEEVRALRERVAAIEGWQKQWAADAAMLHDTAVFIGPCVHGRDPWDRCDECGEETAVHALVKVNNALRERVAALEKERADEHMRRIEADIARATARDAALEEAAKAADDTAREAAALMESSGPVEHRSYWEGHGMGAGNVAHRIRALKSKPAARTESGDGQ